MLLLERLPRGLLVCRADLDRMALGLRSQDTVHSLPNGIQMAADKRLLCRAVLLLEARCPMRELFILVPGLGRENNSLIEKPCFSQEQIVHKTKPVKTKNEYAIQYS